MIRRKEQSTKCDLARNLDQWLIQSVKLFMLKSRVEHKSCLDYISRKKGHLFAANYKGLLKGQPRQGNVGREKYFANDCVMNT